MTENVVGNAVIKASVDSTGVDAGVERVGKSLDGMAARAKAAAGQASQAVGSVGTGGEGAADKLDRTTQRIIGQIERVTAAARAGGRDTAAYFESIGQARGANLAWAFSSARSTGQEAVVVLKIVIESDGHVGKIQVMKGEEPFVSAATRAVMPSCAP